MFPPIVRTRRRHSEKVHGAEADRLQLVLKKSVYKHIRASLSTAMKRGQMEPWRRTSERVTKTAYSRIELKTSQKQLRCPCVDMASNDVGASSCLWEEQHEEAIGTETSRLATADP